MNKGLGLLIMWGLGCLISLGLTGLIIYAVWHFIAKFW